MSYIHPLSMIDLLDKSLKQSYELVNSLESIEDKNEIYKYIGFLDYKILQLENSIYATI